MATNSDSQLLWSFSQEDLLAPNTKKRTFSNWIGGLHFTSDASRLAVATEGEIAVYDIQDGRKEMRVSTTNGLAIAYHSRQIIRSRRLVFPCGAFQSGRQIACGWIEQGHCLCGLPVYHVPLRVAAEHT